MFRARHAHNDRLLECYLAVRHGEPMDLSTAEHLVECRRCGARYAELAAFMDAVRQEGENDSDSVFTAERLRAQQQQIARRLSHVAHPARVISFPEPAARMAATSSVSRTAPRWVAAAAAAGLFAGVALTASFEWGSQMRSARHAATVDASAPGPGVAPAVGREEAVPSADDAFLSELEAALDRPQTSELVAFDVLTPHVREIIAK